MASVDVNNINYVQEGLPLSQADTVIFWAHGWGHDANAFSKLSQATASLAANVRVDLPGFGDSPKPDSVWGSKDYANLFSSFIKGIADGKKVVWVGHSFGGAIGIQLAAAEDSVLDGLFVVAGAGLRSHKSIARKTYLWLRVKAFKLAKKVAPLCRIDVSRVYKMFGSADYRQADEMRPILVKVVNEDLVEEASLVNCPTYLVYGSDDTATPPAVGEKYNSLIRGSELSVLDGQDHYTVLNEGRHLVAKRLKKFLERI